MGAQTGENLNWSSRKGKKVKCTVVQALRLCAGRTVHRGSRGIALLFLDHCTRRGEGSASRPGRSLPPGNTRYPLYRRLGVPQGWSGQVRKISPPPGFDPRTIQLVASRYTDYAIRPTGLRVKYPYFYTDHNERFKYIKRLCVLGSFPGVKCGRGVQLTTHPLLVPRSRKSRAIPLPTV